MSGIRQHLLRINVLMPKYVWIESLGGQSNDACSSQCEVWITGRH